MMSHLSTAASAPGKVLLAGGYLVLDRKHTALVFGLDARVHVVIQPNPSAPDDCVVVRSSQFKDALWRYRCQEGESQRGVMAFQSTDTIIPTIRPNTFVATSLEFALTYISQNRESFFPFQSILITILADDDYYSQTNRSDTMPKGGTRFTDFNVPLHDAHKTGLGSSAALVTAVVSALLLHYLSPTGFSLSRDCDKSRLHNLAQAAHCEAQGKIGSGFDIAAAVYASCLYRRFSPSTLDSLGRSTSVGFSDRLQSLVENDASAGMPLWDAEISHNVKMPPRVRLVMCDVDCGSQSVAMAKTLLAWRTKNPDLAGKIWRELQDCNDRIRETLDGLDDLQKSKPQDYARDADIVLHAVAYTGSAWNGMYNGLCQTIHSIRSLLRQMSKASGVPIEPESQTKLLDACSALPGVIGGVVPGAGGFDAIVLIIIDSESVFTALRLLFSRWQVQADSGDEAVGKVRMLDVRQESEGARVEPITGYGIWIS